jgi:hypothetical protein
MAGFQMHYEYEYISEDGYQFWTRIDGTGDSSFSILNSDYFGDLIYVATPLLINEVKSDGTHTNEWVEIYNRGPDSVHLKGIALTDQDGTDPTDNLYKLWTSMVWIAPGDYAVIYSSPGTDDTTKAGGSSANFWEFYCAANKVPDNFLGDTSDDLLLKYEGNDCGLDYMEYGTAGTPCPTSNPSWGASANGWDDTGQPAAPGAGQSVERYKWTNGDPYDSNKGSDWYLQTTPSEGSGNSLIMPEYDVIFLPIIFSMILLIIIFKKRKK